MQIHLARNGKKTGPFSLDEVQARLATGETAATDLGWHEGLDEWTPLRDFIEAPPPPPLPPAPEPGPPPAQALYFYIPVSRLLWMSLLSLGLFQIYWFYCQWRYLRRRDYLSIWPFWRGVFAVFFIFSLFREIKTDPLANRLVPARFSTALAAGWIIFTILANLVSRSTEFEIYFLGLLFTIVAVLFLLPVQRYLNAVNRAQTPAPPYHGWTTGHIVCLSIGLFLWSVILLGAAAQLLHLVPGK